MNLELSIDIDYVVHSIEEWDSSVFDTVRRIIEKWAFIIETEAKDKAPHDRGQLASSINSQLFMDAVSIVGMVGTNKKYGLWQHEGTKPHWIPFYNPPTWDERSGVRYPDIMLWCERHGFDTSKMKGIYVKGLAHPFMKEAYLDNVDKFEQDLANTLAELEG